jgi:hypothetical protein
MFKSEQSASNCEISALAHFRAAVLEVNVLDLEKTILPLFLCFTEVEYTVRSPRSRLFIE